MLFENDCALVSRSEDWESAFLGFNSNANTDLCDFRQTSLDKSSSPAEPHTAQDWSGLNSKDTYWKAAVFFPNPGGIY